MKEYHKIQTVFLRDPDNRFKTLLHGQYARPEFEYLAGLEWEWTEKIDGTNIRVMWDGETVTFGGKTDRAQIPAKLVAHLVETFTAEKMLTAFRDAGDVCLYGEGCGAGIQKGGGNYSQTQQFVLFDVKVGDWWLRRDAVNDIAPQFGVAYAPVIDRGTLSELVEFVRAGFQSEWGPFLAEGVVARPVVEMFDRGGRRIITKIKTKDFGRGK